MTLALPPELRQALLACAQQRQISLEELVREALAWYVLTGAALIDELTAWQEVRDEALQQVVEEPLTGAAGGTI